MFMKIEDIFDDYMTALLAGDRPECVRMVNALIRQDTSVKDMYVNLFQKSMYEVGRLWEISRISVATEHMCTSITESLVNLCYPLLFSGEHTGKKAVITCTPGEYHQIGARMVADFFELYGWDGYFLGADTPTDDLVSYLNEKKPDLLAISISISFNMSILQEMVQKTRDKFPELPIIAGGQGFRWGGENALAHIEKTFVIKSLDELVSRFLTAHAHES